MDKQYQQLYSDFKFKIRHWINGGKNRLEKENRFAHVSFALSSFKNSNSKFDLYILNKYFDLFTSLHSQPTQEPKSNLPIWLQMTDFRAIEMGLPYGSIHYVTDFLFQNSHDMAAKIYVLKILEQMEKKTPFVDESTFYMEFLNAKASVDQKITPVAPPLAYSTDLHLFSQRTDIRESEPTHLDHIQLMWNTILGRPQVNIVESYPISLNKQVTIASFPQLKKYVNEYFNNFRVKKNFKTSEIDHDEAAELSASPINSTFIIFTKNQR